MAGDVIAFCTNVVHTASRNVDTATRKVMFINFCAADALDTTAGNHDLTQVRMAWREALEVRYCQSLIDPPPPL